MSENDVVVLFYDKLDPVLEILSQYQAVPVSGFETRVINAPAMAA